MSVLSTAKAEWNGSLKEGSGKMRFGNGAYEGEFTFASRFETGKGTNPEELIAAAHAGCFSMQLSGLLSNDGHPPTAIRSSAVVTIQAGVGITGIAVTTEADVPGLSDADFQATAQKAIEICPVSQALAAVKDIKVTATLSSS